MKRFNLILLLAIFSSASALAQIAEKATQGNNRFTMELYHQLRKEPVNMFYSPLSISSAFAMTYAGAKGETATQLQQTLHFGPNTDAFHSEYAQLNTLLNKEKEGLSLSLANAVWIQSGLKLQPIFSETLTQHYGAGLKRTSFSEDPAGSRDRINNWVEEKTHDKITDLLPQSAIKRSTQMILVNALYFKGDWATPFKEENTKEDTFYVFKKCHTQAQMMNQSLNTSYYEDKMAQVVELPYEGGDVSMILIVPKKRFDLLAVEKNFTHTLYQEYLQKMKHTKVQLTLPKFTMERTYSLSEPLQQLGMTLPFTSNADFTGMTDQTKLVIDKVLHKTYIDVNEVGTEAAAATAITMVKTSMVRNQATVKANHPFMFLLKDNKTSAILFMGRIMDPNE
jgi:serpin B